MRAHECVKDIKKDKKRRNGVFKRPPKPFDHLEKMKLRTEQLFWLAYGLIDMELLGDSQCKIGNYNIWVVDYCPKTFQ